MRSFCRIRGMARYWYVFVGLFICAFIAGCYLVPMVLFDWLCASAATITVNVRMTRHPVQRFSMDPQSTVQFLSIVRENTSPHDGNHLATGENVDVYLFNDRGQCYGVIWIHSTRLTKNRTGLKNLIEHAASANEISISHELPDRSSIFVIERVFY